MYILQITTDGQPKSNSFVFDTIAEAQQYAQSCEERTSQELSWVETKDGFLSNDQDVSYSIKEAFHTGFTVGDCLKGSP